MRLLTKSQAMLAPEAKTALRAFLLAQSIESEEMSNSDLMVLVSHGSAPQRPGQKFVFETANHRMARQWVYDVMADRTLRIAL